jgi:hypothetical protein
MAESSHIGATSVLRSSVQRNVASWEHVMMGTVATVVVVWVAGSVPASLALGFLLRRRSDGCPRVADGLVPAVLHLSR